MKKQALVLGTNAGQADLIRHLKEAGWFVWACSGRTGEPGSVICDHFEQVNITDIDAVARIVRENEIDLIYSISSDVAIKAATAVAEATGRPHFYDSALIKLLDDKSALRAFLTKRDLDSVGFQAVKAESEATQWDSFPCIVKPVDAQGQRGVINVDAQADLIPAVTQALALSPSGTAIIEDLLEGVEISCNTLVANGSICIQELSERLVHTDRGFGIPAGHLLPARNVSTENLALAGAKVEAIIKALGMPDGPLYFQMIVTGDGPKIVEIAPRLDGCHMWRLIHIKRGVNLLAAVVETLLGNTPEVVPHDGRDVPMALLFQQTPPGGVFSETQFPRPAGADYHEYRYSEGQSVLPINGIYEVVGYSVQADNP